MFAPPRLPSLYILVALCLITIFLYFHGIAFSDSAIPSFPRRGVTLTPANATLGFGGLYAVSGPGSPRRGYLEQAAAITGLELTFPELPTWTDDDVREFRSPNESESRVGLGSVKAWLSHNVVIREFLASGHETALIFEDDVDWDIRLRSQQIPRAQQAARTFSNIAKDKVEQYPWGTPGDWDLLYLGHCGDYFNDIKDGVGVGHHHPQDLASIDHILFSDPTMPNQTDLHPFTASLLNAFVVPQQTRILHRSKWPLCTFGYAITRQTAERLVTDLAPIHEDPKHEITAYDSAILTACRDGPLKCYSLTPEIFHHMEGKSLVGTLESTERVVFRPPVDVAGLEQVGYRHETSNIGCGFWSGEFYYGDDMDLYAFLKDEVGEKGRCLKKGRDD